MLVATVVSAAVGLVALGLLIWAVKKAKLKYIAIYLYLIGTLTLIFSLP